MSINITVGYPNENYIPDGTYLCKISEWHMPKPNKGGTGQFTLVIFEVIEGEYRNRKIFKNLNLTHINKTAEKIAEVEKNKILTSAGFNVNDIITSLNEIINKRLLVQVINEDSDFQKLKYSKIKNDSPQQDNPPFADEDYGLSPDNVTTNEDPFA